MLMRKAQGKLKAKRVLIDTRIFPIWVDPEIKAEERDLFCPVMKDLRPCFTTFTETLINVEAERLSTLNEISITFLAMQITYPLEFHFPQE